MVIDDLYNFDKLAQSCGNRYLAVMFISESARKLGQQHKEYRISESKLIQWVITGKCPYTEAQLEIMKEQPSDEGLESMLCWVSDQEVTDEVRYLYKKSIRNKKLTYSVRSDLSKFKLDRIHILLRMIWYSSLV